MASVRSIAEHLNISSATVSRVLNSRPGIAAETRQRVLHAAAQLGRDRSVGLKSSRYIGFIHPLGQFVGNMGAYHAALLGSIASSLGQQQYDLALIDPFRDKRPDETYTQFFFRKELQGVIVQVRPQNAAMVRAIAEEAFPMVVVASRYEDPNINWVAVDSRSGYEQAVEYLHDLGHRRIALVDREMRDFDHDERAAGYLAACQRLGLEADENLHWIALETRNGGASAIRRIMSMTNRPTAVVFTAGEATRGALRACAELGVKVPDQLSIIGIDDTIERHMTYPSYTAVCQSVEALGAEAVSMLGQLLSGTAQPPLHVMLPTIFEVHGSTGPAPTE